MDLKSTAFDNGKPIPLQYTCDGSDFSPPLEWSDAPETTESFALIVDDPDAPSGLFTHWLAWNIPGQAFRLASKIPPMAEHGSGLRQGENSFGKLGYGGPCPPKGTHRYFFRLYALDRVLDLAAEAKRADLEQAMAGHVLAEASWMGTYSR
jgi:Raf kinase inhibitor-like YbhB/YbcL family protein